MSLSSSGRAALLAFGALLLAVTTGFLLNYFYPASIDFTTFEPLFFGATFVLVLVADLISFKMRPEALRLSLTLSAVVVAALMLPASGALASIAAGLAFSVLLRRVNPLRAVYELSSALFASSLMILLYHAFVGDTLISVSSTLSLDHEPILAALASAALYAATLFGAGLLFKKVVKGISFTVSFPVNVGPYFWSALASALLGCLVVAVFASAPILLPLTILPAWAVTRMSRSFIYARQIDARASRVADMAELLNAKLEPSTLITSFLSAARDAHDADAALSLHLSEDGVSVTRIDPSGVSSAVPTDEELKLFEKAKQVRHPASLQASLPQAWRSGVFAPLEVDGDVYGVVALGWNHHEKPDMPLWSSLTASLSSALSNAALFAQIEAITASQSEAVVSLGQDGMVTFLNPPAKRLFGVSDEGRNDRIDAVFELPQGLTRISDLARKPLLASEKYRDVKLKTASKELVVNLTVSPLRPSGSSSPSWVRRGVVLVVEDRTASRAAARALADSQSQIMALGRALQASLLPPALPPIPGATISARYHAAAGGLDIGGDFYDVLNTRDGHFNIIMGDVCGRGPEAAALTALTRHTLRGAVGTDPSPVPALRRLNDAVVSETENMFCTVAMGRLQAPVDGEATLRVTLGGHPPVLVIRGNGVVEEINPTGTLIGAFEEIELTEEVVTLRRGDTVVFYTDGVLEARGADGAFFENEGLNDILAKHAGMGAEAVTAALDEALKDFQGGILHDDTAFLAVSVD